MRSLNRLILASALAVGALSYAAPALAQDPDAAACFSAREEMKKLATKNAWAGVERKYDELTKLSCGTLKFDDHFLGAQAAKYQGKTYEMYERLSRAKDIEAKPDVVSELEAIDGRYGRVEIKGTFKVLPTVDVVMPFSPDERKSIEWAQKVLSETGSFKGMLPIDIEYKVNGAGFVVPITPHAGPDWQSFDLHSVGLWKKAAGGEITAPPVETPPDGTKPPEGTKPPKGGGGAQGNIDTAGPVAMLGFNYMSSPEPGCPIEDTNLETAWCEDSFTDDTPSTAEYMPAQIGPLGGAGLSAEVGAEVVFTGKKFAASGTVAYSGAFAPPNSAHLFRGWLAGSFRPGNARLTFGPTYGVVVAQGQGVASWYDRSTDRGAQDHTAYPNDRLPFGGTATMAGFQFTAGYGLLDLEPLLGMVELGGSWATDGDRSYINAGVRVGIVPHIKRFKG